tara:strand:- start:37 stop:525 length:489 start_codon:yes stop_codon:yes gene_type:complete
MKSNISTIFILFFLVMICQIFIPVLNIYNFIVVTDIMIIFLTYIGFYYGRFYSIIFGFMIGFFQDLVVQVDLIGAMAFTKSIIGYGLGTLALYNNVWSSKFRILFIFVFYVVHFIIFYYIRFNGVPIEFFNIVNIIIINAFLSFIILIIFDKSFINKGIFSK